MSEQLFSVHRQLAMDSIALGSFELCQLRLINDCQYPWFILIPQRTNIQEIYQLTTQDQSLLIKESSFLAEQLARLFKADKLNIAAIGNVVPQLHLHHVVRYQTDIAWPKPIWGLSSMQAYSATLLEQRIEEVKQQLGPALNPPEKTSD
jgi:diadenosine tetraphosphate (Ap4A) HIT family hydrolase